MIKAQVGGGGGGDEDEVGGNREGDNEMSRN